MARVSVEQSALTDPRFGILAKLLGETVFSALGRMVYVWNECQDKETYHLPISVLDYLMGVEGGADLMKKAGLIEIIGDGTARIKGTEGRIEWLQHKRKAARINGLHGGRPIKKPMSVTDGFPPETPPAPAPAPTPATAKREKDSRFAEPSLEEIAKYWKEKNYPGFYTEPQKFYAFYASKGWMVGKNKMKNWKMAIAGWVARNNPEPLQKKQQPKEPWEIEKEKMMEV